MTTEERLRPLLEAATPGPWQQSRFVDSLRLSQMDRSWKDAREREEAITIRGAGVVGTPQCNQVGQVPDPDNRALAIEAVNALPKLLAVVAAARRFADLAIDENRAVLRAALDALDEEGKR